MDKIIVNDINDLRHQVPLNTLFDPLRLGLLIYVLDRTSMQLETHCVAVRENLP